MILLDGKTAAASVKKNLKIDVDNLLAKGKRAPHLAAILIGNNAGSESYVASKIKNSAELGFDSTLIRFEEHIAESILLDKIAELNSNHLVDGILIQLPLPKQINEQNVIEAVHPSKDVDGFHPLNAGKLMQGLPAFISATPYGIMLLLEHYQIETKGKHAVIIGRSNIVGRPLSVLLSSNHPYGNCTVTLCHSQTKNIKEICLQGDIIVAAIGKPAFLTADMIKDGAVIIDVGINRVSDSSAKKGYRIVGDVDFNDAAAKAYAITPVPGGVGLMTIAALLKNTLKAYLLNSSIR